MGRMLTGLTLVLCLGLFGSVFASNVRPHYIRAVATDPYTVRVYWYVPSDANASLTSYRIGWRKDSTTSSESYVTVNGTLGYYIFKNLRPYTYYYYRVQRGTVGGSFGRFTRSRWVETPESVPTAPPTNVTAYNTSSLSIIVHWGVVPPLHRNGHILGYRTCYYKASEPSATKLCLPTYSHSNHLGNLKPYTPYYITVIAYTNVGDGPGSTPLLVWTDQFVPSRPPQLVSLTSTTTTITVIWTPIPQQYVHGILRGYDVVCNEKGSQGKKRRQRVNTTTLSFEFKELKQNTMYEVKLAGLTKVKGFLRNGAISPTWNITTKPGTDAPTNVKAHSPCSQCMMVQWDRVIQLNPAVQIVGYHVILKSRDGTEVFKDVSVNEFKTNVTGLKAFTTYSIRVATKTRGGMGKFSQPITETTQEGVPNAAPKQVNVRSLGPTSILVSWSPLSPYEVNGVLQGYYVYYKHVTTRTKRSISTGVFHVFNISASSVEVKGLQPFALYEVTVAGFTKKGSGPKSAPMTVRTHEEVPSRAPEGISAKALDAYSLLVTWQQLPQQYTNGHLKGYQVHFRAKTANTSIVRNAVTVNASTLDVKIKGLEPNTLYEIWIEAFTAKGLGPESKKVTAKTMKIVPGQPQDVRIDVLNPRTVKITWHSVNPSGSHVTGYMVKWTRRGHLDGSAENTQKIVKISGSYYRLTTVNNLLPYNMYTFTVRELHDGKWGKFSAPVDQMMPEDSPSAPLELSVHKKVGSTLVLSWKKPEASNGVIRKYVLYLADIDSAPLWEETVNDDIYGDLIKHTFILPDKTAKYRITVQAFNSLPGRKSEVITVNHISSQDTVGFAKKDNNAIKLPWLIFIISAIALFLLGIIIFFLIRKSQKKPKKTHEEELISMIPNSVGTRKPIPVSQLKQHCNRYHAYDDALFVEEFKTLNHVPLRATCEASQASYNKTKNRYPNILPYDHSRVGLKVRKDSPSGYDYINASFIDGYRFPRKYIATQGPLRNTVIDFWRMVWEKGSTTIVMLGSDENSLKLHSDCEQYWPEHGYQEYGSLAVSLVEETCMSDWNIRIFLVWSTDPECMDKREITQYQYTAWPDQGVPENTASILMFQHKLRAGIPQDSAGPIVVHCGAGVGRTGTFITIDSLLEQRLMEGVVDVYGFVAQMRTQRTFMVQTEDQYAFIYDVLRDASICGITEINSQEIGPRLLVVSDTDPETLRRRNDEFNKLPVYDDVDFLHSVAMIRENIVKNRCPDVLPFDRNRVSVIASAETANTDYINASFVDGYNERHAYIATQAPMENTVLEFWQMVWEQQCTAIVMLSNLTDRAGHEECAQYWPTDGCLRYGKYIVTKIDEETLDDHTQRVFKLRCHGSMDSLLVYHFQYHNWQHNGLPPRTNGLVCLHEHVQKIQLAEDHGPTIVHCSDGAGRAGVYLTLALCIDRLEAEDNIDIFQTVRWLRTQRRDMVGNAGQYNFCYHTVKSYLSWRIRATNHYVTA